MNRGIKNMNKGMGENEQVRYRDSEYNRTGMEEVEGWFQVVQKAVLSASSSLSFDHVVRAEVH